GLLASELCNLRLEDLDVGSEAAYLTIHRTKPARIARIALPRQSAAAIAALAAFQKNEGDRLLFGRSSHPITRREMEMLVQRYGREAEVPELTPHALRFTFCLNMCATPLNPFLIAS